MGASVLWCSLPSVSAETVAEWSASPSVEAFVLRDDGHVIGYGELWVDPNEREVELVHVIVAPARRGRGLGGRFTESLVEQARRHYPLVALRVHSQNDSAIRSYLAADFNG